MLSLALGKTLEEIEAMPASHLAEYELYYQEQPFGSWRDDYRAAQITHALAMIHRNVKLEPPSLADYMPFFNAKINEPEDDSDALWEAFNK